MSRPTVGERLRLAAQIRLELLACEDQEDRDRADLLYRMLEVCVTRIRRPGPPA